MLPAPLKRLNTNLTLFIYLYNSIFCSSPQQPEQDILRMPQVTAFGRNLFSINVPAWLCINPHGHSLHTNTASSRKHKCVNSQPQKRFQEISGAYHLNLWMSQPSSLTVNSFVSQLQGALLTAQDLHTPSHESRNTSWEIKSVCDLLS